MDDPTNNLVKKQAITVQNGLGSKKISIILSEQHYRDPPDKGARAWLVMIGAFVCNGIIFGVINSYGIFQTEISDHLKSLNDSQYSSKAALVGSLTMGATFILSPVSGILTDSMGLRFTTFLGGTLVTGGMLLSSFFSYQVEALYFTFGIMYGLGGAMAYTPSLAILGHYFKKYLGLVNGIVTAGSPIMTVLMNYVIYFFLQEVTLAWTFRLLALLSASVMGCALLFKPLNKKPKAKKKFTCSGLFNVSLWQNKRYVLWSLLIPFSLIGYFVPYVHMMGFVKDNFPEGTDGKLPITCIAIGSGVGRLIFGYLADSPRVNRILLQQGALFSMGLLIMAVPLTQGSSFIYLLLITVGMGLFDGCFISLLGPIAFDLCGQSGATQAIGYLLGLCSVPITVGPYFTGVLYEHTQSYSTAFVLSGVPTIIGALAMTVIHFIKKSCDDPSKDPSLEPLQPTHVLLRETSALDIDSSKFSPTETDSDRPEDAENPIQ